MRPSIDPVSAPDSHTGPRREDTARGLRGLCSQSTVTGGLTELAWVGAHMLLYPLGTRMEALRPDPRQRTEWNVRDCDRLMVLVGRAGLSVSKGTTFAVECAKALAKPHIVIDIDAGDAEHLAAGLLEGQGLLAVNIGGPRESEAPGIYASTKAFLSYLLPRRI